MESRRKIAILCHTGAGGSGVVATELAIALAGLGHQVHIVATERPFRLTDDRMAIAGDHAPAQVRDLGENPKGWGQWLKKSRESVLSWLARSGRKSGQGTLHFHQITGADYPLFKEPMTILTASNALAQVVERHGIEIVHAHYAIPHATSALMAREMGLPIKVVTTLHGTDVTLLGLEPAFAYTTKHAAQESDAVTAVSRSLEQDTRRNLGIERPIHVIYNWVDTERFKPDPDPASRLKYAQPEEAILLHASNFRPVKRPQDVIRIFATVASRRPARLLMIGNGPLRQECQELALELELAGRVQFIEFTPSIEKFMAVADVFLLPSEEESFGLVALEAMSCGVPVVASQAGGLPEVVVEGESGHLLPVGHTEAMAEAVLGLLADSQRKADMGRAARERAVQHFRPEHILPRYLEVYQSVLEGEKLAWA